MILATIYGIDLGTTNSVVSIYDPAIGQSIPVSPLIPSFVNMKTGEVGVTQKEALIAQSTEVISSYKINMSTFTTGKPSIIASSHVLKEAATYMPDSKDCVITVPAYFQNDQRLATLTAAKNAGLNVKALINEPTAAAIYHSRACSDKFIVYDLGGGTFDVTVIDTTFGISDVQATDGEKLGGDDLNKALYSRLISDLNGKRHKISIAMEKALIEQCEGIKRRIQKEQAPVTLDLSSYESTGAFDSYQWTLTPESYRHIMSIVFGSTLKTLKAVVRQSGYDIEDLRLLLVGGSTHDPYLIEMISTYKVPEEVNYNKDTVVSLGAAYYGYLYDQGLAAINVSDITKGIGVELATGFTQFLIPANSKLPIVSNSLLMNNEQASTLHLNIVQGNNKLAKNNDSIGELDFNYKSIQAPNEGLVLFTITVNTDGVVNIKCRDAFNEVVSIELKTI